MSQMGQVFLFYAPVFHRPRFYPYSSDLYVTPAAGFRVHLINGAAICVRSLTNLAPLPPKRSSGVAYLFRGLLFPPLFRLIRFVGLKAAFNPTVFRRFLSR